jgi:hypothetical protein
MKTISSRGFASKVMWSVVGTILLGPCPIAFAQASEASPSTGTSRALTTEQWVYSGLGLLVVSAVAVGSFMLGKRGARVGGEGEITDRLKAEVQRLTERLRVRENGLTSGELPLALERVEHQLTKSLHDRCNPDWQRQNGTDPLAVAAMVARHREILERPLGAAITGASPASREWKDLRKVCQQLANFGLIDEARALLGRPDVDALLPKDPPLMPGLSGEKGKIDSGSRCLECALLWCQISEASQHASADVQQARAWFKRSVAWLPNEQDIEVLLQWAHFERGMRDTQGASEVARLLGEARARVERVPTLSPEDRVRVLLESADDEMDRAGVPVLGGSAREGAVPSRFGSTLGAGGQLGGLALEQCKQYLERADEAIQRFPRYYQQELGGSAEVSRYAPVHFRVQCAYARMHLGVNRLLAEQSLLQALGEHVPCSSLQFVRGGIGGGVRIVLQSDWSRLEIAGNELSAADRQLAQTLRLRWVEFCIEEAEAAQSFDSLGRQTRWRDAAWLLCRYWVSTDSARLTGEFFNTDRLSELTRRVVGRSLGMAPLGVQTSGWEPDSFEDRAVSSELQRRIRQEPPPPPPPSGKVNLVCQAVIAPSTPGTVEELRLFDASGGAGTFSDHSVMVDVGGGGVVTRHGSFGYPLNDGHKVPVAVNPALVNLPNAIQAPLGVRGSFRELARFGLDGLSAFGPGFDVVLKDASGNERGRVRMDGLSAPGNGNPGPVDIRLLEQARLDLEEILAGLAVGAPPMNGVGSRLNHLADQFEGELGSAFQQLCPPPAPGAYGPRHWLNREHMEVLWERASSRFDAHGNGAFDEPASKLVGLDAKVRDALRRFLVKYVRENPNALALPALARLGIAPGGVVVPPPPIAVNQGRQIEQPLPDFVERERRFEELRRRAFLLGLERRTWLFELNRAALHDVVCSMIDRVQNERAAAADPTRGALLARLEGDLATYRDQDCRPLA